jgi:hypothetical protein
MLGMAHFIRPNLFPIAQIYIYIYIRKRTSTREGPNLTVKKQNKTNGQHGEIK